MEVRNLNYPNRDLRCGHESNNLPQPPTSDPHSGPRPPFLSRFIYPLITIADSLFPYFIVRLRERLAANGGRQGGHHRVRHYRNAPVSALLVQYWRHPGQVLQMDLRQSLPLPHLPGRDTPPGRQGTAKGAGAHPGTVFGERLNTLLRSYAP